jgi:palmitoyltransferase ZDHHC9/14/18
MRPLRSQHCFICDRCVKEFDHHCIWLGTCIAARNYKQFLSFLFWTQVSFVATLSGLLYQGFVQENHDGGSITTVSVLSVVLLILWVLVGTLSAFHIRLITLNNTTNEYVKKTLSKHKSRWNPHSDYTFWGNLKARFVVGPTPHSLLN